MRPDTLAFVAGLRSADDYLLAGYASDDAVIDDPIIYTPAVPSYLRTKGYPCQRRVSHESTPVQYSDPEYSNLMAVTPACKPISDTVAPTCKPISKGSKPRRVSFGPTAVRYFSNPGLTGPVVTRLPDEVDDCPPESSSPSLPTTRRVRRKARPASEKLVPPSSQPETQFYTLEEEMRLFFPWVKSTDTAANRAAIRKERRAAEERRLPKPQNLERP